jgi:F0F1-type ATP synthase assembly protein I
MTGASTAYLCSRVKGTAPWFSKFYVQLGFAITLSKVHLNTTQASNSTLTKQF